MQNMDIAMDLDTISRYQCNACARVFIVTVADLQRHGSARCPACLSDDVAQRMTRMSRLTRFFMFYEAF